MVHQSGRACFLIRHFCGTKRQIAELGLGVMLALCVHVLGGMYHLLLVLDFFSD